MAVGRFSEETKIRVSPALNQALDLMVRAQFCTKSDYVRRALVQQIKADGALVVSHGTDAGVQLAEPEVPHA
jgi:hypothetical protein